MKTIYLFAAALFIMLTAQAQNYQWQEELLSGYAIHSVCFPDPLLGFAAGGFDDNGGISGGIILKTNDGGMNWETIGTNFFLHSLYFFNETKGYAIGDYILRTVNGGEDWQIVDLRDEEYQVDMIHFPEDLRGYVTGEGSKLTAKPEDHEPYGIENITPSSFRIYPNPAASILMVEVPENHAGMLITILNIKGETVNQYTAGGQTAVCDISSLQPGIYFIRMKMNSAEYTTSFIRK